MHVVRFRFPLLSILLLAAAPGAPAADTAAGDDILAEVIVTGRLRAEELAEVPASVTVLGEGTLKEAGLQHFQDVLGLVPNLNWAAGSSRPRYFQIRGIGEREQYEGAPNPSVGFLIDDIDFSGLGMPATLFDLKQIEVLRGAAGARSTAPMHWPGSSWSAARSRSRMPAIRWRPAAATSGTRSVGVTATGPVAALGVRVAPVGAEVRERWLHQEPVAGPRRHHGRDELTARLKWHAQAGDSTTLDFTFLHADLDNGYDAWSLDNTRTSLSDEPGVDRQRANAGSLRLTSGAVGPNVLTAIGSYARSATNYGYDYDWGDPDSWAPLSYEGTERWDRLRRVGSLEIAAGVSGGRAGWRHGMARGNLRPAHERGRPLHQRR